VKERKWKSNEFSELHLLELDILIYYALPEAYSFLNRG